MILFVHVHNISTCFILFIFLLFFCLQSFQSDHAASIGINMLLLCSIVIFPIPKIISRLFIKKQTLSSEVPQIEKSKVRLIFLGVIFRYIVLQKRLHFVIGYFFILEAVSLKLMMKKYTSEKN